jgi:Tol biopolymer transport system component
MINRVSLPELEAAQIRLRPAEAVALVAEICRQNLARILPGIPSPGVIRLLRDGGLAIEGPVRASHDDVARAATLLNTLLPGFDAPPEFRASGALRLLIARALGTLDLPPFASLEDFTVALARFTNLDARETAASLFGAWEAALDAAADIPLSPSEPVFMPAALEPERQRNSGKRWIWAMSAAALLVLSALAGWHWADSRIAPASIPPTVVHADPAPEPAPVAPPPAPERMGDSAPVRDPSPRVIRASAYSPAFGSDAALYFHEQQGGASVLKVALTGRSGEITQVASIVDDRALNFHPRPSPDGSRIAFDSDRDGTRGVFVAPADGSGVARISGPGYAAVPSWSPDGTRLAFVRAEPDAPRVWNLWTAAPDGSHLQRRTHHKVGQAWGASWFPDGRRVAYSVETRLMVLDLQSGRTTSYRSPVSGRLVRTPAVAPDGSRIIFQVHREGVWVLDLRTGLMESVLDDPTAEEFTWTPDGRRVAFHSRRSGEWSVWLMAP